MTRLERAYEWLITKWGDTATSWMRADSKLLQAAGLVLSIAGILVIGTMVVIWILVDSTKKRCSAKNASRSATSRR